MQIVKYPDPRLKQVSDAVEEFELPSIRQYYGEMLPLMKSVGGIGLAAVQVGIMKRFAIVEDNHGNPMVIINPEIVAEDEEIEKKSEGCLSLPLFHEEIERPLSVTVRFRDLDWKEITGVFNGLEARCLMHELDHMNGVTQDQKVSQMKLGMWLKKAKKRGAL